jgi:hypothetical protein
MRPGALSKSSTVDVDARVSDGLSTSLVDRVILIKISGVNCFFITAYKFNPVTKDRFNNNNNNNNKQPHVDLNYDDDNYDDGDGGS